MGTKDAQLIMQSRLLTFERALIDTKETLDVLIYITSLPPAEREKLQLSKPKLLRERER
jgi:hypothetical protein